MSEKTATEMLREMDERATKGPWREDAVERTLLVGHGDKADSHLDRQLAVDARLIATLRNALPELAALVEAVHLALARHNDPSPRQAGKIRLLLQERYDALTEKLRREVGDE